MYISWRCTIKVKVSQYLIQQHTMLAYVAGGEGGAEYSGIVPSHFELCRRASTSEFLFLYLVGYK
jgi:hypothetical protein